MRWQDHLLTLVVLFGVLMMFVIPIYILFFDGLNRFALRPLVRCFQGIRVSKTPSTGDVSFVYHTYRGFLVWFTQDEHRVIAPKDDAEILLKRLLRFNLTWGMLSYGVIFIPIISYGNYLAQRRSITHQSKNENHSMEVAKCSSTVELGEPFELSRVYRRR